MRLNRKEQIIIGFYKAQLKKFKSLSVYEDGEFVSGGETEFGVKVTKRLIDITESRMLEIASEAMSLRGVKDYKDNTNSKAE